MTQPDEVATEILETRRFMLALADRLDDMVANTKAGGWSSHQSEVQTQIANDLRRRASRLTRIVGEPGEYISITILKAGGQTHAKT